MTKKDYIKIAQVLKEVEKKNISLQQKIIFKSIVYKLSNIFYQDNDKFDNISFENTIYDK